MFPYCHAKKITIGITLLLVQLASPVIAEVKNEHKVKAAILYKVLRYVSWPEEALETNTIKLCVDINDPYFAAFSDVNGRSVHDREIVLSELPDTVTVSRCQIVFTSAGSAHDGLLLSGETKDGVLTISDASGFAERGGMINLVVVNNRVRFKINPHAAYQSNLSISSSLLRLADIVETDNREKKAAISLHVDSEAFE